MYHHAVLPGYRVFRKYAKLTNPCISIYNIYVARNADYLVKQNGLLNKLYFLNINYNKYKKIVPFLTTDNSTENKV